MYLAGPAGILEINGSFFIEVIAFILMLLILAKYAYPRISAAAEARQQTISRQLEEAEAARRDAQEQLAKAKAQLDEAREQAQEVINGAARSGEQIREELKAKGEEEATRQIERAKKEIEAARQQAVDSVRDQVAGIVVAVTEKVLGEGLDGPAHQRLIDRAIKEVEVGGSR